MYFNVRVYGLLINEQDEVLISDEEAENRPFTKFPGGGLEFGEGLIDALKREYREECNFDIEIIRHVYTTDFYEKSSFNDSQIISVYYQIRNISPIELKTVNKIFDFEDTPYNSDHKKQCFRWVKRLEVNTDELTFKTDKIAWEHFLKLT